MLYRFEYPSVEETVKWDDFVLFLHGNRTPLLLTLHLYVAVVYVIVVSLFEDLWGEACQVRGGKEHLFVLEHLT